MKKDFQYFVNELEEQQKIFSDLGKYFFGIHEEYQIDIDNLINLINRKLNHINNKFFFKDIFLYLSKDELEKIYNVYLYDLKNASNSTILNFKENNILGNSLELNSIDWYFMLSEYSSYIEIVEKDLNIASENEEHNQKTIEENNNKNDLETIIEFKDLFKDPELADKSLIILRDTVPGLLTDDLSYCKGTKGIFPLFITCLKELGFIKRMDVNDKIIKNSLNNKVKNLKLSQDASEFKKNYKLAKISKIDLKLALKDLK